MTLLSPMLQPAPTSSALLSDVLSDVIVEPIQEVAGKKSPGSPQELIQVTRSAQTNPVVNGRNRTVRRRNNFESDNFDLSVADREEGPIPAFVLPGHIRGCPRCVTDTPKDLKMLYCQSKSVYLAETRPARGHRLRLVNNVSLQHARFVKMNSSVDMLLEPNCQCSFFQQGTSNRTVLVLGLPSSPLPSPPAKLVVGPELFIIDSNPKQINIKSMRNKCDQTLP
ncbi:hypothetical protein DAPPUDRAFT_300538 [Daphnia pulex]|uniref:Uncharacterized protein n=1 Tax=Daphnia pulex TaxID=6669 RepID=E9HDC4_DAPPU|nr:hypothetical protein DAPPUDRAFT_300538 [Daphnia pulex]|eukprot:EFX70272.1 hypothetical protein DAPPUDRAFT_300538 [Daphnia pulex]